MHTPGGAKQSKQYNETIRIATIEHAMIGQIRNPSRGFEHVIKTHFKLKKDIILNTCAKWIAEQKNEPTNYNRLLKCVKELKQELDKL